MKIPYGISNFKALREEKYLYIDKTKYIETIENLNSKYVFFIRPRRFGKSLFLSTLEHYYDINSANFFQELFGSLYIGKNKTELKNSYLVLKLNFSALDTSSREKLERSFKLTVVDEILGFLFNYQSIIQNAEEIKKRIERTDDLKSVLLTLLKAVKQADKKIYLIIDEYDHFANDIIAMGDSVFYKDVIRATGFVRDFYEAVKIGTETVIDRIFITGISPVMLDDLTSGFNMASNLTLDVNLNEMLGFTEKEVKDIVANCDIEKLMKSSNINMEKNDLMHELKKNYNGYLFNKKAKHRIYNPDMILYFFDQWGKSDKYPEKLIDDNVKTDYGRLNRLMINEENRTKLEEIIEHGGVVAKIITRFSFDNMNDEDNFISLLFYMGLLTNDSIIYGETKLGIPNYVTKEIFWEYFNKKLRKEHSLRHSTEELAKAIWQAGIHGEITPFIDFISTNVLKKLSNRDLIQFDEKYIKMIILSYLVMSNVFRPNSEKEIENGYIDLYLEKDLRTPEAEYEWLLELKYLKKSEEKQIERAKIEGLKQLKRYANSSEFQGKKNLKKALIIFSGKSDYVIVEE
ncbi:MAG: ATP-binding protein [Clostridiales bacterium]|nr:ATP-binding protein [Clostridiales bacterium]